MLIHQSVGHILESVEKFRYSSIKHIREFFQLCIGFESACMLDFHVFVDTRVCVLSYPFVVFLGYCCSILFVGVPCRQHINYSLLCEDRYCTQVSDYS